MHTQQNKGIIGIVGGVGPYAGVDLFRKILDQTIAFTDQEHLPIILISLPESVSDRTEFILNHECINPAYEICRIITMLDMLGADVIGIPCNTIYSKSIYNVVKDNIWETNCKSKVINLIDEVIYYLRKNFLLVKKVGVLSTFGSYIDGAYAESLTAYGFEVVVPDYYVQVNCINKAIYDPAFGIKTFSNPVSEKAKSLLEDGISHLIGKGAEIIILGCTEIPLAITQKAIGNVPLIDTTLVLARALIREVAPDRLKL